VNFKAECTYNGSAWVVVFVPDWESTSIISEDRIEDDAVTEDKIADNSVSLDKMAGLANGNIIKGSTGGDPEVLDLSTDGALPIGDATNGLTSQTISGAISLAKDGTTAYVLGASSMPSITKIESAYSNSGTTAVTTEETLFKETLSAGLLSADGMGVRLTVYGTTAANANNKTIRLKIGGNTIVQNSTTAAPNSLQWKASMDVIRSGATSSVCWGSIVFNGVADEVDTSKPGITWANAIDVDVSGQNGTASANDIVVEMVVLELIK
jgi:hypothetical protein